MYDVQAFIGQHRNPGQDPELIGGAIRRLLEIWHAQDVSTKSTLDRALHDEAEQLVNEIKSYGLSADEIETIDEWSDDFRAFLHASSITQSKEPAA